MPWVQTPKRVSAGNRRQSLSYVRGWPAPARHANTRIVLVLQLRCALQPYLPQ
jgi:hypothetical protein